MSARGRNSSTAQHFAVACLTHRLIVTPPLPRRYGLAGLNSNPCLDKLLASYLNMGKTSSVRDLLDKVEPQMFAYTDAKKAKRLVVHQSVLPEELKRRYVEVTDGKHLKAIPREHLSKVAHCEHCGLTFSGIRRDDINGHAIREAHRKCESRDREVLVRKCPNKPDEACCDKLVVSEVVLGYRMRA